MSHTRTQVVHEIVQGYREKDKHNLYADRLDKAEQLVCEHKVTRLDDNSFLVQGSREQPYMVNGSCSCEDVLHGKAPAGWCKHKIACKLWLELQATPYEEDSPAPLQTAQYEPGPKATKAVKAKVAVVASMPEAPASLNLKLKLPRGHELMYTMRSMVPGAGGDDELRVRLGAVLDSLEALGLVDRAKLTIVKPSLDEDEERARSEGNPEYYGDR